MDHHLEPHTPEMMCVLIHTSEQQTFMIHLPHQESVYFCGARCMLRLLVAPACSSEVTLTHPRKHHKTGKRTMPARFRHVHAHSLP